MLANALAFIKSYWLHLGGTGAILAFVGALGYRLIRSRVLRFVDDRLSGQSTAHAAEVDALKMALEDATTPKGIVALEAPPSPTRAIRVAIREELKSIATPSVWEGALRGLLAGLEEVSVHRQMADQFHGKADAVKDAAIRGAREFLLTHGRHDEPEVLPPAQPIAIVEPIQSLPPAPVANVSQAPQTVAEVVESVAPEQSACVPETKPEGAA